MEDYGHRPRRHVGFTRSGRFARQMMVVVASVFALSLAVPALAGAHVTWATNYIPVSKSTAMEWTGKLKFSVSKTYYLECADTVQGSVGANGAGEITKMPMSSCKNLQSCGSPVTMTALNLPWHTELVSEGGVLKNVLSNGGKGNPGFKTECTIVGIKISEECTAVSTLSTTATNSESGVTAAFNSGEKLNCSYYGAASGTVEGSQSVTASGGTLSAQKEEPVWLKAGLPIEGEAKSTEWSKGTISLYVPGGGSTLGVRCEDSGQGTAGAAGAGTITKFTMTKCERAPEESACDGAYSLEATHLPWKTELYFGSAVVGESFTEGGAGVPKIKLKCEWGSKSETTTECEGAHMGSITNAEHGVFAEFAERGLSCSGLLPGAQFFESHQTISLTSAETLHVS